MSASVGPCGASISSYPLTFVFLFHGWFVGAQTVIQDIGDMGRHAGIFLELCGSREPQIAEAASECLVLLLKASPQSASGPLLSNLGRVVSVLETCAPSHTPSISVQLQRHLLYAISASCKEQSDAHMNKKPLPTSSISNSDLVSLENIVVRLRKSSSTQVADAAVNAAYELQRVPRSS